MLHELRIQISSSKYHKWAIIFIRSCIILHNLILRLEGGNFDEGFREHLYEAGRWDAPPHYDLTEDEGGDELHHARRQVETEGQCFCHHLMVQLFNSPFSGAVRRER
jgi:hypothetical protein